MSAITISLTKPEKERLQSLALRYGFSLPEFSRQILAGVSSEIPTESFAEYAEPKKLKVSFGRALRDWKAGRVSGRV